MKGLILIAVAAVCIGSAEAQQKPQGGDGWIRLFEGKSLAGWHPENDAKWVVSGGTLVGSGGDGWLRSDRPFSDFQLRLEYRAAAKTNSGVFLRCSKESKHGDPPNPATGYELQIYNEEPKWPTGTIEDVLSGYIGLQHHKDNGIAFRNIVIKPLPPK